MNFSEFGVFWLWFLLVAYLGLWAANSDTRRDLRSFGADLWELFRTLWSMVSYQKEAEPIDQDFKGVLSRLLRSGFNDAFAYVRPKFSKRRIEFRKYIRKIGDYGIELRFRNDERASAFFQNVLSYCEANELSHRIESQGIGDSPKFLCVDFGQDVDAAASITRGNSSIRLGRACRHPGSRGRSRTIAGKIEFGRLHS